MAIPAIPDRSTSAGQVDCGAAAEPLQIPGIPLLMGRRSILGWPSGSSIDSQDTLAFSQLTGVRVMTEAFPLERAAEAMST